MKPPDLVTDRVYAVYDRHKIKFEGVCLGCEGGWADFKITGGVAARLREHGWKVDDKIRVCVALCKFYLVSRGVDNADPS